MGIFNADVIINIPPAFFSLQKSGLVRVYLTSVFLLLSVPRCFGDQKPQFDCGGSVVPGGGGEEKVYWFWSKGIAKRAEELPSPKEGATCNAVWVEEVGGNVATSGVHG